ncbi:phage head-tail connector protein [bacterium AH-315-P15]|nr:phage head-tail connector protein [bacterium AH-315-P15]
MKSMATTLLTAPGLEPIVLTEAKAHLRIDHSAEDSTISEMIAAARQALEDASGLALITQSWQVALDAWPGPVVELPKRPAQSITEVRVTGLDGTATTLATSAYELKSAGGVAHLVKTPSALWIAPGRLMGGIEIDYVAGYGSAASDVPRALRQALLMVIAHVYENRELLSREVGTPLPAGVDALLAPYRRVKL